MDVRGAAGNLNRLVRPVRDAENCGTRLSDGTLLPRPLTDHKPAGRIGDNVPVRKNGQRRRIITEDRPLLVLAGAIDNAGGAASAFVNDHPKVPVSNGVHRKVGSWNFVLQLKPPVER